jgi:DNA-directed RNA polymerase I, II, and III subunit RPABC1
MSKTEQHELFKARKTVLEMLADRGYEIPESMNISEPEFSELYDKNIIDISLKDIYVFFLKESTKISKANVIAKIKEIQEEKGDEIKIILCLKEEPNNSILQELKNIQYRFVEIFTQNSLVFNITKHEIVPKHRIMDPEESKAVLEKYKIKPENLPYISRADPIAKYYGAKGGQIMEITRFEPSTGKSIYYRLVV